MMTKTRAFGTALGFMAGGICFGKALNHFSDFVTLVIVVALLAAAAFIQNMDQ